MAAISKCPVGYSINDLLYSMCCKMEVQIQAAPPGTSAADILFSLFCGCQGTTTIPVSGNEPIVDEIDDPIVDENGDPITD